MHEVSTYRNRTCGNGELVSIFSRGKLTEPVQSETLIASDSRTGDLVLSRQPNKESFLKMHPIARLGDDNAVLGIDDIVGDL
jgi:hypothetical protein